MKISASGILRLGFTAAVMGILLVPLVTVQRGEVQSSENRSLASFPSIKTEEGNWNSDFCMELESWFSDRFGQRSKLVTAYGSLTQNLLATSSEADVIVGKNDFLYYTPATNDAVGIATITKNGAKHIAHSISMMQAYADAQGTKALFTVAPNKASIYPQYLPARYLQTGGQNNLDLVSEALKAENVTYCDLRTALSDHAKDAQIYHKLDTHWNGKGAMVGFSALMNTFGHSDGSFPNAECTQTHDFEGDLQKMLAPDSDLNDDNFVYNIPNTFEYKGRFRGVDDMEIQTSCSDGSGSLLMVRDSFGRALIPLLSQVYENCTYLRSNRVLIDALSKTHYDNLILEIVERNLPNYLEYAPKIPAAAATLTGALDSIGVVADKETGLAVTPEVHAEKDGKYLHIYGTYHEICADCDAVYCEIGGQTYEAFPCYETELLKAETTQDNGFSLFLPYSDATGMTVRVIARKDRNGFDLGTAAIQ